MAKELDKQSQERWQAFGDNVRDLVEGADDEEGFKAAWAALKQVSSQLDGESFLNALHIPKDAGEYEEVLRSMLERIPDGWGRWISCSKGWYPLLVQLDSQLKEIAPTYQIHQCK